MSALDTIDIPPEMEGPFDVPPGTEIIEILAKAPNGIFFPIFELKLSAVKFSSLFQPIIMLRYSGQISQLKEEEPLE